MKKRLLIIAALLCLLVLVGAFLWQATRPIPPASTDRIPLPDGSWVHLEAVTYGTNHLVGPRLAMLTYKLPPKMQLLMLRVFGKHASMRFMTTTPTPQLVLWLNRGPYANKFPSNLGYMRCVITDTNGFAAGEEIYYGAPYPLEVKPFNIFPRRDPEFVLRIYHLDLQGTVAECGQMRIANPVYRSYPEWKPESLPVTKSVGDVEATLKHLVANVSGVSSVRRLPNLGRRLDILPAMPGEKPINVCQLTLRSTTDDSIGWQIASVALQDATGNQIECDNAVPSGWGNDWFSFSPGLWTNESAWKVTFGIKRTSGFQPDELLKFENAPLSELNQSNRLDWTTNLQGVAVTLLGMSRYAATPGASFTSPHHLRVEVGVGSLSKAHHFDLIELVTDDGTKLRPTDWSVTQQNRTYRFSNLPWTARTADLRFVIQTNRTVEFMVKPDAVTKPMQFKVESE